MVPHRSTNRARTCLTSLSRREAVLSCWYGRSYLFAQCKHMRILPLATIYHTVRTRYSLYLRVPARDTSCYLVLRLQSFCILVPQYCSTATVRVLSSLPWYQYTESILRVHIYRYTCIPLLRTPYTSAGTCVLGRCT